MKISDIEKEDYTKLTEVICNHMQSEHEFHLGQFEAEFLLDDILKFLIPVVYNRAIDDAARVVKSVSEKMEEELDMRKIL